MDRSVIHIRPRFEFVLREGPEELMHKVHQSIINADGMVIGKIVGHHVILDIPPEERHYWSPQLSFRLEEDEYEEGQTVVRGLIGPRPAVWTMFMFIYFAIAILGFFISSFGISKLMLGEFSGTLLAFPIALVFMMTAYAVGKYGESLGKDQIEVLKQFVRDSLSLHELRVEEDAG